MRRCRPASASSTLSTGIAAIVVQFGLAMMPLRRARVVERVRVDLADDERDLGVHAPRARVVDDEHARRGEARRLHLRHGGAGREDRDVEPARVGGLGVFDGDLLAAERQRSCRRCARWRRSGSRRSANRAPRAGARTTAPTWPVAPTTPRRMPGLLMQKRVPARPRQPLANPYSECRDRDATRPPVRRLADADASAASFVSFP